MPSGSLVRRALAAGLFAIGMASAAGAQTYDNPNLPRSPYRLPEPTYRADELDVEGALDGNGKLHSSGQWRHWGDKRNSGEFIQQLIAPSGTLDLGQGSGRLPRSRYCADNPDAC